MTLLSIKSSHLLALVFCVYLTFNVVSYPIVLFFGILVIAAIPLFLVFHAIKLPRYSEEKVRLFLEKTNGGPIAHRGGKPENTLAALSKAKSQGAFGVEVDLSLTKDGHAVLLHDATVDRTSNGKGRIDKLTLKEAKELDFGSHCGVQFVNERIPTLKEAITLCQELDLVMLIEVKNTSNEEKSVKVILDLFSENPNMYDRVAVVSFYPNILYKLRSADPDILCGFTIVMGYIILNPDGIYEGKAWWKYLLSPIADRLLLWSLEAWLLGLLGVKLLLPNKDIILRKRLDVERLKEQGMCVIAWTVNKREEMEHCRDVLKIPYLTDFVTLEEQS